MLASARGVLRYRQTPRANTVRPYVPLPIGPVGRGLTPPRHLAFIAIFLFICRGRRCGVAQRSMPQRGIEPHERASSAGWRRSLCAAKRQRPVQFCLIAKFMFSRRGGFHIRPGSLAQPRTISGASRTPPPLRTTKKPQQRVETTNRPIVERWPRAGASPSALGFLRARLRSVRAKREPKRP